MLRMKIFTNLENHRPMNYKARVTKTRQSDGTSVFESMAMVSGEHSFNFFSYEYFSHT